MPPVPPKLVSNACFPARDHMHLGPQDLLAGFTHMLAEKAWNDANNT